MADPKHPRHYEESFKRQIVQLYENGKPSREIQAEYDIARSTLLASSGEWQTEIRSRLTSQKFCQQFCA